MMTWQNLCVDKAGMMWGAVRRMNNDPLSPILDQLYPGARVHHGFLNQFEAVTDKAANDSENIRHAAWASSVWTHKS